MVNSNFVVVVKSNFVVRETPGGSSCPVEWSGTRSRRPPCDSLNKQKNRNLTLNLIRTDWIINDSVLKIKIINLSSLYLKLS